MQSSELQNQGLCIWHGARPHVTCSDNSSMLLPICLFGCKRQAGTGSCRCVGWMSAKERPILARQPQAERPAASPAAGAEGELALTAQQRLPGGTHSLQPAAAGQARPGGARAQRAGRRGPR